MHFLLLVSQLLCCAPAVGVSSKVTLQDSTVSAEPSVSPTAEPTAEPSAVPASEPTAEPDTAPTAEPSQEEPTSEPSQEEPPPVHFSDFVEDELGVERGTSGLYTIEEDLRLWLDARETSTLLKDSTDLVLQWSDRSDFSAHAVQSDSSRRPSYNAIDQMLEFNGSQVLFVENQSVDVSTTYFVVYKGSDPVGTLFAKANQDGNWSRGGKSFFIRGGRYTVDVGWVGYFTADTSVPTASASIVMFLHQENGAQDVLRIYQNGLLEKDSTWEYTRHPESDLGEGIFKIGDTSNNFPENSGLYGNIGELIKIDQSIGDEHRILIHAYLASKWGITAEVDSDADGIPDQSDGNPVDPTVQ